MEIIVDFLLKICDFDIMLEIWTKASFLVDFKGLVILPMVI